MRCGRCGKNNPENVNKCLYCGASLRGRSTPVRKHSANGGRRAANGKLDKAIVVIIVVLAVVLIGAGAFAAYHAFNSSFGTGFRSGGGGGGGGYSPSGGSETEIELPDEDLQTVLDRIADLNGGILPELTYDETGVISFIDGKYTNRRVTSYDTAIQSLIDIRALMQIENPMNEYEGLEMYKQDSNQFYKLQQVVDGVPVYNRECIVETDSEGSVLGMMCDYDPGIDIDTVPSIGQNEAAEIARQMSYGDVIYSNFLYVFNDAETPVLAWGIDVGDDVTTNGKVFISAVDGSLVSAFSAGEEIIATGIDANNRERTFNVKYNGSVYTMEDEARGISVEECNNSSIGAIVSSQTNTWNNGEAISAMSDVAQVLDYYTDVLNTNAFAGGKLRKIVIQVNFNPNNAIFPTWSNAVSNTLGDKKITTLKYGQGYTRSLDITAHEFTHSIIRATCDFAYMNEAGALNEAYADVLGNLIQNNVMNSDEWDLGEGVITGPIRNIQDPTRFGQPDHMNSGFRQDYCYEHHDHEVCDYGGVHTNSGIINRAAYLMYEKGITDKLELANIFSRSMNYLHSNSSFKDCRAALIRAAREMNLSNETQRIISDAFAEVGIENTSVSFRDPDVPTGYVSGRIADAESGSALYDAHVRVADVNLTNPAYEDGRSDENGSFTFEVQEGTHGILVTANGYIPCLIGNVTVTAGETTYLENTILLSSYGDTTPLSRAGGTVTNAVSGEPVEGAVIKFREGWSIRDGAYVKNTLGNDIALTTNETGEYYTSDLQYGYYTAEVVRDGFATQYINIVAAPFEMALNQDILLAPIASGNEYRITLEWDENPRDEDAHIVGEFPNGNSFHVYYSDKNAILDGETVANLDHDDRFGNGFETVTLKVDSSAVYKYYVHHFAGDGSLSTSNAKVTVYRGGVMVNVFNVPVDQGTGLYWNVFNIVNGEVVPINEISDEPQQ